jgi:hypothetical protein
MHRTGSSDRGRELEERLYQQLIQAFREGRMVAYRLRSPQQTPCALGESHQVNGVWQSITLIYGSWDTSREHARVTTWRELPGQTFHPDVSPDIRSASSQGTLIQIDGQPTPATLRRGAELWQLRTAVTDLRILVTGRGPIGDLTLETLDNIVDPIAARQSHIDKYRR